MSTQGIQKELLFVLDALHLGQEVAFLLALLLVLVLDQEDDLVNVFEEVNICSSKYVMPPILNLVSTK